MSLNINSLTTGYGQQKIIEQLSVEPIQNGELVAVLGPNGVGKSTLLKAIARLQKYQGDVSLDGEILSQLALSESARRIGYLPQTLPQATSLVAYEIVFSACRAVKPELSKSYIEQIIEKTFSQLGITHLALKQLAQMSGGQRQMIGLAQVLIREPRLLLLDEPTSALDLHWQISVLQAVKQNLAQTDGIGLVAIHDINLALRFCDKVLVLSPDGLVVMGKGEQVLTEEVLRKAYGVKGRVEQCSQGYPIVLADEAMSA
ncbi:ABC transporter ATP-binding protein [Photobacterium leiognathi]|uniref:ABC transporter ATP-binding protein n=1 Tax=Photobacterium leiognathi TaxID=553611 RepID=UPI002980C179|nr:ABC transporter ATP-binding protein [Photobacterium leiognathi]